MNGKVNKTRPRRSTTATDDMPKPDKRVQTADLPQRHPGAPSMLTQRLEVISAKMDLVADYFAREDLEADISGELVGAIAITRQCATQLASLYCRLSEWEHGNLNRIDLVSDGYNVDRIETAEDQQGEADDDAQ